MKIINHQVAFVGNDELHVIEVSTHTKRLSRVDRNQAKHHISQVVKRKLSHYAVSYSYPHIMMYFSNKKVAVDIECHVNLKSQYSTIIATEQEMKALSAVGHTSDQ